MSDSKDRIPLQISNKVVLVPIRYQLTQMVLQYLKEDLLKFIAEHTAIGVIFDLKGMEMVDAPDFEELTNIIRMIRLMGLKSVVCGISAGVVSSIVDMDMDTGNLETALDLNAAFLKLQKWK